MNIGQLAKKLLLSGMSNKEVLRTVLQVFPHAETSMKCIYYYSSQLGIKRNKGSQADEVELKKVLEMLEAVK